MAEDIRTVAIRSLWSKYRLTDTIPFELYQNLVESNCSVCGCTPTGVLHYKRGGESYDLYWNHLQIDANDMLQPVCSTCKFLLTHDDLKGVLKTCARIMARRLHGKIDNWLFPSHGKPVVGRSTKEA